MKHKLYFLSTVFLLLLSYNCVLGQSKFATSGKHIVIEHMGPSDKYFASIILTSDEHRENNKIHYNPNHLYFALDKITFNKIDSLVKNYSQLRKPAYAPEKELMKNECWRCPEVKVLNSMDSSGNGTVLYGHNLSSTEEVKKYFSHMAFVLYKNNGMQSQVKKNLTSTIFNRFFY